MTFEKYIEIVRANLPEDIELAWIDGDPGNSWHVSFGIGNFPQAAVGTLHKDWLELAFEEQIVENTKEVVALVRKANV